MTELNSSSAQTPWHAGVRGGFKDGHGEFYDEEDFGGRKI